MARRLVPRIFPSLVLAVVAGILGAAILHLVIILSLPSFSDQDAYTRVLAEGELHRFHRLSDAAGANAVDTAGLRQGDPFLKASVCAYDISDGPVHLGSVNDGAPFWSLGVFDSGSNEVFSINDRTSAGGALDVVIATATQMNALRKAMPQLASQSILVEAPSPQGFVVLRALSPQKSFDEVAAKFLDQASCAPFARRT